MGVILVIAILVWFLFSRRRRNKGEENTSVASAEVPEACEVSEMPATENWHQSSGPSEMSAPLSERSELAGREARQELDSGVIHEADRGMSSPRDGGEATQNPFEYR